MIVKQIKLSSQAKDRLGRLKGKTGIKNWNVLCRWALCYSLSEGTLPTDIQINSDSNVEMSWYTFAGEYSEVYEALMIAWCQKMKLPTDNATLAKYFKLNLERGIAYLAGTNFIKSIDDLLNLANMQKKYLLDKTTFKKIDKPVLSLRLNIDVLIYDDKVYFFNMSGEKLFNMERAYKIVCDYRIIDVVESGILVENEEFKKIASAGTNPRRLVSFNTEYLERLKNKKTREKIAKKFDIPIREGKFDTEQDGAADKLIRVLCKKGMVDPFDSEPMEVSGTRSWS